MLSQSARAVLRTALRARSLRTAAAAAAPPGSCASPRAAALELRAYASSNASEPSSSKSGRDAAETRSNGQSAFYGAFPTRTHTCGELRPSHADQQVILAGWLQSSRQVSKQLAFFDLFDHTGSVQLKVQPTSSSSALFDALADAPLQSAVLIHGNVALRPSQDSNTTLTTGAVEILPTSFTLLNPATRDLPFQPSDSLHADGVSAELRARYRYLDLRRPSLANNLRLRSQITHAVRNHLYDHGFLEIETPVLLRSTPEGAREFLVPTRASSTAGTEPSFYALPQSPQQPKQLLIASGVTDKYFQIAKCFRDEDGRKDRQPEFTQIDLEMGFVSGGPPPSSQTRPVDGASDPRDARGAWRIGGHQVRDVIEALVARIWHVAGRGELPAHFPVMSYWTAMTRYGSDKPDLRYGLELHDISHGFVSSDATDDDDRAARRTSLEILPYHHASRGSASKKELEMLLAGLAGRVERFRVASPHNVQELAALLLKKSALTRTFLQHEAELSASEVDVERLANALRDALEVGEVEGGGVDVFVSLRNDPPEGGSTALGDVRKQLAALLLQKGLLEVKGDAFSWITEFPLFTLADEDKNQLASLSSSTQATRWQSSHHPFTAPVAEDIHLLNLHDDTQLDPDNIAKVRGQHYDLVLNGQEIGGGSVRIHSATLQQSVFQNVLKLSAAEQARFAHLIHALDCGAPPHAGIALGFDRLMAILCNTESIRDVIAFPKQSRGIDPLFASPAPIADQNDPSHKTDTLLSMYRLAKASPPTKP